MGKGTLENKTKQNKCPRIETLPNLKFQFMKAMDLNGFLILNRIYNLLQMWSQGVRKHPRLAIKLGSAIHVVLVWEVWKLQEWGAWILSPWCQRATEVRHCVPNKKALRARRVKPWRWSLGCSGDPRVLEMPELWDMCWGEMHTGCCSGPKERDICCRCEKQFYLLFSFEVSFDFGFYCLFSYQGLSPHQIYSHLLTLNLPLCTN